MVAGGGGNIAAGTGSAIPGGGFNTATGNNSFAAGYRAKALADGSIVFGDGTNADVVSNVPNQFAVAASGGIVMATSKDLTTGCSIAAGGGTWNCTSDRNAKRDFLDVDSKWVLGRVAALPLSMWRYQGESRGIRHLGPTAQDFRDAFGLGSDDRKIAMVDADGVALAAIQGLLQLVQEKDARISALEREVRDLKSLRNEVIALRSMFYSGRAQR